MTQKIYQLLVVGLFVLSIYGWGRLMRRFLDRRIFVFHALTAIVGLAVLSVIGGLLNLVHLARTPVLLLLIAIGLAVVIREALRRRPWQQRTFALETIPLFVAPAIALCVAVLLMPAGLFNIADDFHTYIARTTRMVETGTLSGSSFDALGLDSLGSPSFFHAIFLSAGGIELLNGFDAVACFALCLWLLAELSLRWRIPWWLGLMAMFGFIWINPQCVNISPLYAGAAGVMALALCGMFLARSMTKRHVNFSPRLALSLGLIAAWLVTMKVTLAFFAGIFLATLLLILFALGSNRRALLKTTFASALAFAAGVLPWALVSLPGLLHARMAAHGLGASAAMAEKYPSLTAHETPLLFLPIHLSYGNTPVLYLAVSVIALALSLAGLVHWISRRTVRRLAAMPAIAAVSVASTAILFLNSHLFPIGTAIRYSCPILIGGIFIVALGFLRSRTAVVSSSRKWLGASLAAGFGCLIFFFNTTFLGRLDEAMREHSLLAFKFDRDYASYAHDMLARDEVAYHSLLQTNLPPGSTALVWTATPFHFDFQRNHLLTMSVGGISNPALRFPAGLSADGLEKYLRNNGVQFVVLEKKGYGVVELNDLAQMKRYRQAVYKKFADYGTYLRVGLDELTARGKVLYSDDRMVIFELGPTNNSLAEAVARNNSPL